MLANASSIQVISKTTRWIFFPSCIIPSRIFSWWFMRLIYGVSEKIAYKLDMLVWRIMMNKIYIGTCNRKCKLWPQEGYESRCGGGERKDIERYINMTIIKMNSWHLQNLFKISSIRPNACITMSFGPVQNGKVCHWHLSPLPRPWRRDSCPMLPPSHIPWTSCVPTDRHLEDSSRGIEGAMPLVRLCQSSD